MDKEKEIEKMLEKIHEHFPNCRDFCKDGKKCFIKNGLADCVNCTRAVALLNGGYGDVRAAVKDIAERIKTGIFCELADDLTFKTGSRIEKIINEVCGDGD